MATTFYVSYICLCIFMGKMDWFSCRYINHAFFQFWNCWNHYLYSRTRHKFSNLSFLFIIFIRTSTDLFEYCFINRLDDEEPVASPCWRNWSMVFNDYYMAVIND